MDQGRRLATVVAIAVAAVTAVTAVTAATVAKAFEKALPYMSGPGKLASSSLQSFSW